jgi:hypothetical protein
MKADGSMTRKRVTMQNQTLHLILPAVRRRSVTPKEILDSVDAKQDIVMLRDVPKEMVRRFLGST